MNREVAPVTVRVVDEGEVDTTAAIHKILGDAVLPLPVEGDPSVSFLIAERSGSIVGCAGWESHPPFALVRSVAITESARERGVGSLLMQTLLDQLTQSHYEEIFLVTLEADSFFSRFGFNPTTRDNLPEEIGKSPEFNLHCCESGKWMRRSG